MRDAAYLNTSRLCTEYLSLFEKQSNFMEVEMSKIGLERLFVRSSVALGTSRSNDRFRTIRDGHNI